MSPAWSMLFLLFFCFFAGNNRNYREHSVLIETIDQDRVPTMESSSPLVWFHPSGQKCNLIYNAIFLNYKHRYPREFLDTHQSDITL